MKYTLVFGLCCVAFFVFGPISSAFGVDPIGRPSDLKKDGGNGYFIWYEDGVWHVQTRRSETGASFQGTIQAISGKISAVWPVVAGKAKAEKEDKGWLNGAEDKLSFSLHTGAKNQGAEGRDGFNFQVSDATQQINFKISRTNEKGLSPGPIVRVGANNEPPSEQYAVAASQKKVPAIVEFTLPAHPEKKPRRAF
jgi:hypothetical protein